MASGDRTLYYEVSFSGEPDVKKTLHRFGRNRHRHSDEDVREEYYINDQKVGTIQVGQYIALDLVPGHYAVKAIRANVSSREVLDNIPVDLVAGQVIYLYSSINVGTLYHDSQIVWCDEKCQSLVVSGHRVIGH